MINSRNTLTSKNLLDILLHSPDATAIYKGENLEIQLVNDAMLTILGKDKSIQNMDFEDALPEMAGQPFTGLLKRVWRTGKDYSVKDMPVNLVIDGVLQTFYFDFCYRAVRDENGDMSCILHTAKEVSDRMEAWELVRVKEEKEQDYRQALAAANEEYQATNEHLEQTLNTVQNLQYKFSQLVSTSPVGMTILKGRDLCIDIANTHMLKIWGRSVDQVTGKKLLEVFPELIGQPFPEMLKSVFDTGKAIVIKETSVIISDIDGNSNTIYVDFAYEPLFDISGIVSSILATVIDITNVVTTRKVLEQTEVKMNQLNEELAAANEEYQAINEELSMLNEEYTSINEELNDTNEQLLTFRDELELANALLKQSNTDLNLENASLSLAEAKALSLLKDAPLAIGVLTGKDLCVTNANPELLKLWGKNIGIIGKPLATAIPELQDQHYLEVLAEVLGSGIPYYGNEEKVFLNRNGQLGTYYFNFIYKPLSGINGKPHSVMIVASEVTVQVTARRAVEEANARLELALNAGRLGSYEHDLASGKMECSEQCKNNFGLQALDQINFEDLMMAISPEFREYVDRQVQTAISQNHVYEADFEICWPDGSKRWIQTAGRPKYDKDGKPTGIVGVTQDVTEQKAYEQRKDDFLSIASHELKTPITVLKANLQMLERLKSKIDNSKAIKLIENASGSMGKITTLIEDLLNISKHSEGKLNLNKSWFDINSILESCFSHVRIEGKHKLDVQSVTPLRVFADEHRIEQVLINFINNAVKYAPNSHGIKLTAELQAHRIKVCVQDFGKGIAQDQIPHLFERYWQANHTAKKYTGLGLGLFICAEIIKRHGGEIGAESSLDQGSTFWFTLPVYQEN